MCADIVGISAMSLAPILVRRVVGVDHVRAVVLVGILTLGALETSPDLRADANAVALLDLLDVLADFDSLANDFVSYAEGTFVFTPAAGYGVTVEQRQL